MAIQLKDRIYTTCPTIGKADIEIGAVKEGYQGWESITDGNTVYYCITDDAAWEVGYGVKTGTEIVRNLLSSSTGSLLSLNGNSSVFCTYPAEKSVFLNLDGNIHFPSANVTANAFVGKGSGITNINAETNNLAPEAPTDGETYARNNKTWVSISESAGIPDAPVDGLMYGRQDGEWNPVADAGDVYTKTETNTLLDAKADKATTYTKPEVDASQNIQDNAIASNTIAIQANTDAIAALPTPVDTYTKSEIDAQQEAQDNAIDTKANQATTYTKSEVDSSQSAQNSNISSNTTAIGALSGRVSANEQDIATLQDGIFFSSSYTTDYPSSPNRDPETGNIYLQDLSAFTYSYADANQVFISKTDEQGNVRQFTAVKPDDILVLNQVESPNYGRYKVSAVNDLGDYVNVIMDFQVGEGTVLEGDTLALQAFPASEGGTGGGIPEAPIDGKQYGRQDATWTEVTGGGSSLPKGSIVMWSDPVVPEGWQICDGTNDTPDLRDKFVVGAGTTYALDATGGSADAVVVSHGHSLSGTANSNGAHIHKTKGTINEYAGSILTTKFFNSSDAGYTLDTTSDGAHTHSVSGNASDTGVSGTNKNLPPYYSIYYIMKMVEGGGGSGGSSIWTDVDGDAVLETDGKSLTIDANVAELGAKARITTDTNSLELKVGSGGLPDVTITDAGLTTEADMTVNGMVNVQGGGSAPLATALDLGSVEQSMKFNINNIGNGRFGFGSVPFNPRMYFPADGKLSIGSSSMDGAFTFKEILELQPDGTFHVGPDDSRYMTVGVDGKVSIPGSLEVNGVPVTGGGGGGSPIVIAGEVNKAGAKAKGTGFTSAKIGGTTTNTYKVTFDTEMPNTNYIVLTTAVIDGVVLGYCVASARTTSYVNINTSTSAGAQALPFQFVVINLDDVVVASTLGGVTNRADDIAKLTEKLDKLELKFKALK